MKSSVISRPAVADRSEGVAHGCARRSVFKGDGGQQRVVCAKVVSSTETQRVRGFVYAHERAVQVGVETERQIAVRQPCGSEFELQTRIERGPKLYECVHRLLIEIVVLTEAVSRKMVLTEAVREAIA